MEQRFDSRRRCTGETAATTQQGCGPMCSLCSRRRGPSACSFSHACSHRTASALQLGGGPWARLARGHGREPQPVPKRLEHDGRHQRERCQDQSDATVSGVDILACHERPLATRDGQTSVSLACQPHSAIRHAQGLGEAALDGLLTNDRAYRLSCPASRKGTASVRVLAINLPSAVIWWRSAPGVDRSSRVSCRRSPVPASAGRGSP